MDRVTLFHAIFIQFCILLITTDALPSLLTEAYPQSEELCFRLSEIDPDRTAFHFQSTKNWINDPNGPVYYKGLYHLFYQYNPYGAFWGTLVWGHSISTDLVNWESLDVALDRTDPFDINGCWSGSVTFVAGQPVILYTGIDAKERNVQNIAFPRNGSDLLMREWDKPGYNPIMLPVGDINPYNFRDPTTAWFGQDGYWRTAVGAKLEERAEVLIYKSRDFINWKRNKFPLHKSLHSGMWECPDFFPVSLSNKHGLDLSVNSTGDIKHLLKVSLMRTHQDYYLLGSYDEKTDVFTPDEGYEDDYRTWPMMDYGHVYASKSFFDDKKNRRVYWAWLNESDSAADDVRRGWSGLQTLPRAIWLDSDGKELIQWPIEEINSLRKRQVQLRDFGLQSGVQHEISGISASQADVEVEFELQSLEGAELFDGSYLLDPSKLCTDIGPFDKGGIGPFGLFVLASDIKDQEEYTAIYFRIYKNSDKYTALMCSDLRSSSRRNGVYKPAHGAFVGVDVSKDKIISLRTLIDHSVVESFEGGGRTCMTMRVYPKHVLTSHPSRLYAFNHGSQMVKIRKLNAWEMANARVNVENDDFISKNFI